MDLRHRILPLDRSRHKVSSFFLPAPVRKMCCAVMTGDDAPSGSVVCQTTFNLGPNSVGNPAVSAMPDAFGPRNAGQSAAAADIDDITIHPTTSNPPIE